MYTRRNQSNHPNSSTYRISLLSTVSWFDHHRIVDSLPSNSPASRMQDFRPFFPQTKPNQTETEARYFSPTSPTHAKAPQFLKVGCQISIFPPLPYLALIRRFSAWSMVSCFFGFPRIRVCVEGGRYLLYLQPDKHLSPLPHPALIHRFFRMVYGFHAFSPAYVCVWRKRRKVSTVLLPDKHLSPLPLPHLTLIHRFFRMVYGFMLFRFPPYTCVEGA